MANQAIALGIRAPQGVNLSGTIQQNSALINMMAQQKAAERQTAQAQQKMALEAELAGPQLAKAKAEAFSADQKALTDFFDVAAKVIGISRSPEDVRFGADMLKQKFDNPLFAQMIDQTIQNMPDDPQMFNAWQNQTKLETMNAKDQVPYFYDQVKTEAIIGEGGDVGVLTRGGTRAPTIKTPRSMVPAPTAATPALTGAPPIANNMGGDRSSRLSADLASPLLNVKNDADYQTALMLIKRADPEAAAQLKQIMPVFNPAMIDDIRAAARAEFNIVPQPSAGGRGGMGGPYEAVDQMPIRASSTQGDMVSNLGPDDGYVEAPRAFRARVPAPPRGPQPRETPAEVGAKEEARLAAQRKFALMPQPPKPMTPLQEAKLRDNITTDYKAAKATIDQMTSPKTGLTAAVDAVRKLSRPQKISLTGYSNYFPSITSGAKAADVAYGNLVGKITEMGKTLASLGGAIGPMAVQEWDIVRKMVAETDPVKMDPDALDNQLEIIRATAIGAAERIKDAYENQYIEEFARYPGRFQLNKAGAAPAAPKQSAAPKGGWGKAKVVGN